MSLQKNFPRDRRYYFWAIFLCHLIAVDKSSSENDQKLFGTLAYRMITKAAADVPQNVSIPLSIELLDSTGLMTDLFIFTVRIIEPTQSHSNI